MKSIFQRTNYFILLASGAMLIGFAPIFVKLSMLSSSAISFYRMFLALPFLFLLNYILNKKLLFKVSGDRLYINDYDLFFGFSIVFFFSIYI